MLELKIWRLFKNLNKANSSGVGSEAGGREVDQSGMLSLRRSLGVDSQWSVMVEGQNLHSKFNEHLQIIFTTACYI